MKYFQVIVFIFLAHFSFSQRPGIPKAQNPPKLVNNFSKEFPNFISASEQETLEQKLVAFSKETSNQIVVVIIDDLAGYEPWDFAAKLGESWGVGLEKEDNGIVILIKPTGGSQQRKAFISPGRGLTAAIPSLIAKRIVENELIPNFKEGNFYKGIDDATTVLMQLAKGEYNAKDYKNRTKKSPWAGIIMVIFIVFIFILFAKNGGKGGKGGGGNGFMYGAAGFMAGRAFGGGFGGGSSGGSSGGFGGFGGGSFGGGGAGGSW